MSADSEKPAISVRGISKTFRLPHERHSGLKQKIVSIGKSRKGYEDQKALSDVSFEIKKGEFFGIVGRNGSGKSTLLKTIAGIYAPDKGRVVVNGKLVPFIELGVGFNPELTGRENVFLNGALLGFSRKEMLKMYDEIVEFAELERFMDQKLKNYSSGMQVRLAFSIAIRARGGILLIDEVLAVGDESFRRKCLEYFEAIKQEHKTVIFVSHDMSAVKQFCNRAILFDTGRIVETGKPDVIAERYSEINLKESNGNLDRINTRTQENIKKFGNGKAEIASMQTTDDKGNSRNTFGPREQTVVKVEIVANAELKDSAFGLVFKGQDGKNVFATNTVVEKAKIPDMKKGEKVVVSVEVENIFNDGFYTISSAITDNARQEIYCRVLDMHKFEVGGWELTTAIAHPHNKISAEKV